MEASSGAPTETASRAPGSPHLAFLDGWRGFAVLLVIAGHFIPGAPYRLAGTGVELFFVLSGRLMAEMLIVRRQPLKLFFFRRASRLLPALLVFATAMLLVAAVSSIFGSFRTNLTGYVASLLFFQNFLPESQVSLLFEHTWSLAVEEHSYLMLAAIAALVVRGRRSAMIVAALLAAAAILNGWWLSFAAPGGDRSIYWRTDVRAASILMSFVIFLWAKDYFSVTRDKKWAVAAPLALIAGAAILIHPQMPYPVRFSLGTLLLAISIATIDHAPAAFRRMFELKAITALGLISYSVYLWQQPFYHLTRSNVPILLGLVLAVGGGVLSYRTIEQPVRRRLNHWYDRRTSERSERRQGQFA